MPAHKWQFAARFRRNAFGWRSATPIKRIKEAIKEIKQVAKQNPELAAEGSVRLLEKLSPALMHVDSSSGALGNAVNKAIDTLVPIIIKPDVTQEQRQAWLQRLWQAIEDDEMPYLEHLGDRWGELCKTPELASAWADDFMPTVRHTWELSARHFFNGTMPCLSALLAAGRYQDLIDLVALSPDPFWHYRRWVVYALVAQGKKAEAIRYAEDSRGLNTPDNVIANECEDILLNSGFSEQAYQRYAIAANQRNTYLATFRAIRKKYPDKAPETILQDLINSTPGEEGKWFAAAKSAGLYSLAAELVNTHPANPATLTRAAVEFADKQPAFALTAGLAALRCIAEGHGYDITAMDVFFAYSATCQAAANEGVTTDSINTWIRDLANAPFGDFVISALARELEGAGNMTVTDQPQS